MVRGRLQAVQNKPAAALHDYPQNIVGAVKNNQNMLNADWHRNDRLRKNMKTLIIIYQIFACR